ncbi:MAG: hypothetical protein JNM79_13940 [Burkholderiales bacterium]|nr:hypothetical protein [Burkholderiales bacterium]
MSTHRLQLFTDRYGAAEAGTLAPRTRALYVVEGSIVVRGGGAAASLDANGAWCGAVGASVSAGKAGARVLRFELAGSAAAEQPAPCAASSRTLDAPLDMPAHEVLMRCDRVNFPPGGEALTHVHQGPGIRCLLAGSIRIDTKGTSHAYGPGEAWFEAGPDPVYAAAARDMPSAFARVMILPRSCHGKSSIRYVRPEDAERPKTQSYQIFADEFIDP